MNRSATSSSLGSLAVGHRLYEILKEHDRIELEHRTEILDDIMKKYNLTDEDCDAMTKIIHPVPLQSTTEFDRENFEDWENNLAIYKGLSSLIATFKEVLNPLKDVDRMVIILRSGYENDRFKRISRVDCVESLLLQSFVIILLYNATCMKFFLSLATKIWYWRKKAKQDIKNFITTKFEEIVNAEQQ